jgi:catalase-peroxidase
VLTDRPGTLTNDFFVNLLHLDTTWAPATEDSSAFTGTGPHGERWTGSRSDLLFGSNAELRAIAEVYASDDAREQFVRDFVTAWDKVMTLDRFELTC